MAPPDWSHVQYWRRHTDSEFDSDSSGSVANGIGRHLYSRLTPLHARSVSDSCNPTHFPPSKNAGLTAGAQASAHSVLFFFFYNHKNKKRAKMMPRSHGRHLLRFLFLVFEQELRLFVIHRLSPSLLRRRSLGVSGGRAQKALPQISLIF